MKKAQMSLEMIIGLLILLVVAVVVIRIFLKGMEGASDIGAEKKLKEMGFYADCESLCSRYLSTGSRATLANFCTKKISIDIDGDGITDKFKAQTRFLDICEDSIYCFHMVKCETDYEVIDWDDCRAVVCQAYEDVYPEETQSGGKVDQKVAELFTLGSCKDIPDDENWLKLYFNRGDNRPCSNPPAVEFLDLRSLTSCTIDNSDPANPGFTCVADYGGKCSDADVGVMVTDSVFHAGFVLLDSNLGSIEFIDGNTISGTLGSVSQADLDDIGTNLIEGYLVDGLCGFGLICGEEHLAGSCTIENTPP
ncbi:MAG: hypothetical protein ISS48_03440 [Candidatus Aenigmarchaeota archaeon]|nr:hypothetical protein [Candidatus Aenigmarchaeota archaeon]